MKYRLSRNKVSNIRDLRGGRAALAPGNDVPIP
jgi:hypothetical protein